MIDLGPVEECRATCGLTWQQDWNATNAGTVEATPAGAAPIPYGSATVSEPGERLKVTATCESTTEKYTRTPRKGSHNASWEGCVNTGTAQVQCDWMAYVNGEQSEKDTARVCKNRECKATGKDIGNIQAEVAADREDLLEPFDTIFRPNNSAQAYASGGVHLTAWTPEALGVEYDMVVQAGAKSNKIKCDWHAAKMELTFGIGDTGKLEAGGGAHSGATCSVRVGNDSEAVEYTADFASLPHDLVFKHDGAGGTKVQTVGPKSVTGSANVEAFTHSVGSPYDPYAYGSGETNYMGSQATASYQATVDVMLGSVERVLPFGDTDDPSFSCGVSEGGGMVERIHDEDPTTPLQQIHLSCGESFVEEIPEPQP